MNSSDGLNVGDVTGPRWAGGTRNPDKDPWEGFTGQSQSDADAALITEPLIERIQALREQLAAAEAAKADAWDEGARYVTADSTYTEMFDIPKNPYRSGTEGSGQ